MIAKAITPGANHAQAKRFAGFSIYEDAAGAALIIFRHGTSGGDILGYSQLVANTSETRVFGEHGYVDTPDGVYVEESSGSITGVLYHR